MARDLLEAPASVLDGAGAPRYGSYRGAVAHVDLSPLSGAVANALRRKRWVYVGLASGDVYVAACVVNLGYASNGFVFAYDRKTRRMLAHADAVGGPRAARVSDGAQDGCRMQFRSRALQITVTREAGVFAVRGMSAGIDLDARLDAREAPPSITAIAPVRGGVVNVTEKRLLLAASGSLRAGGRTVNLEGGLGGYDYTHGLLGRRTAWRWAFALGTTEAGEPFGLNLVQGFTGDAECAAWWRGEVHPLAEGRFDFDREAPLAGWRVTSADEAVDLRFDPGAMHEENKNFGVVRTRFVQPAGVWTGTVRLGEERVTVKDVLGVAEDQDAVW